MSRVKVAGLWTLVPQNTVFVGFLSPAVITKDVIFHADGSCDLPENYKANKNYNSQTAQIKMTKFVQLGTYQHSVP